MWSQELKASLSTPCTDESKVTRGHGKIFVFFKIPFDTGGGFAKMKIQKLTKSVRTEVKKMKVAVLGSRSVALDILNKSKYEVGAEVVRRVEYKAGDVVSFEVVVKEDAEMLAEGFDECDPNREYLVLTHGDGQTSTFRNSLVDLFLMPGRGCK